MACEFPYLVDNTTPGKNEGYAKIPVPCGKCYDCRQRLASQWALRLRCEEEVSTSSYFVTLTYDTQHVPISPKGFKTLQKSDFQDYIKRLRKLHDKTNPPIKYFAVGEYGSQRYRPHYHALIFNAVKSHLFTAWSLNSNDLGGVHVGTVGGASIAYTLKYVMKESKIPLHPNDDRVKEFRLMSKKMGLSYLTAEKVKWHRQDETRVYTVIEEGVKVPLPRYYRERIWDEVERDKQNVSLRQKFLEQQQNEESKFNSGRHAGEDYRKFRMESSERRTVRAQKDARNRDDL